MDFSQLFFLTFCTIIIITNTAKIQGININSETNENEDTPNSHVKLSDRQKPPPPDYLNQAN